MTRPTAARLNDILEAIGRIRTYEATITPNKPKASDAAYFDAILYRLIVIGEAIKALPPNLTVRSTGVPWNEIARLRDLLAHHYQQVELEQIRETCDQPLAELERAVVKMQAEAGV